MNQHLSTIEAIEKLTLYRRMSPFNPLKLTYFGKARSLLLSRQHTCAKRKYINLSNVSIGKSTSPLYIFTLLFDYGVILSHDKNPPTGIRLFLPSTLFLPPFLSNKKNQINNGSKKDVLWGGLFPEYLISRYSRGEIERDKSISRSSVHSIVRYFIANCSLRYTNFVKETGSQEFFIYWSSPNRDRANASTSGSLLAMLLRVLCTLRGKIARPTCNYWLKLGSSLLKEPPHISIKIHPTLD